jgi:hypothetical protein
MTTMADASAASAAAEQGTSGWHEVEQTLTTLELPPVPPTSDPQRLLGYVLHIMPRYTEMEMLTTHLRLYASTLEQDMEQVKSHVRILTREAADEREKKQFLERYAAQVVKERNDLLHSRGSSKKKSTAGASHFVWHNCCKKNTSHAMDLAPSILAFRGEKLQDATRQIEALQDDVHNQELLRKELDFLLKKTQREHDSKVAADRKHIQQLEKQIMQRATLHSSLERKLYEVESVLARHDKTKDEELGVVSSRVREAEGRIASLEEENERLRGQVTSLSSDRDRLTELLEETTVSKDLFAEQIDEMSEKCQSLESEVEALRSEIDMLQTKDINDIRTQYAAKIDRLQKDSATNEQKLRQEIDRVKQELKKRDEALAQTFSVRQSPAKESLRPLSSHTSGRESLSEPADDARWSDGIFDDDRHFESDAVGSSLSRSQLSESHVYEISSSSSQSHFDLSKEIGADASGISIKNHKRELTRHRGHERSSQQGYSHSSLRGYTRELDVVSRDLSTSSRVLDSQENGADASAVNEPFDWETFIDSASEISALQDEHLSTSTIHHEDSMARVSDADSFSSGKARADSLEKEQRYGEEARGLPASHAMDAMKSSSTSRSRSLDEFGEEEEEKESDRDDDNFGGNYDQEQQDGNSFVEGGCSHTSVEGTDIDPDQGNDQDGSATEGEHPQNDLARDLYQMLNGLEQKRKEEEQKASLAEQALLKFQELQQGVEVLQVSPDSELDAR